MAYTDTVGTSHKLGTGAAVLALEAGLALALVTGLAHTITPRTNDRVEATNIPLPKPSDPPPPEAPHVQAAEGLLQPNRAGVPLALQVPGSSTDIAVRGPGQDDGNATPARRVGERVHLTASRLGIWELSDPALPPEEAVPTAVAVNLLAPEESRIAPRAEGYATWTAPVLEEVQQNPWLADFWRVLFLAAIAIVLVEWLTWHRRVTI